MTTPETKLLRVCIVCCEEYEPDLDQVPASFIYCSEECAWDMTPRSPASMKYEEKLLKKMWVEIDRPN